MKEHCGRCKMAFRVEEPPIIGDLEQHRCPECQRRFWSIDAFMAGTGEIVCAVGIFPADAKRIE